VDTRRLVQLTVDDDTATRSLMDMLLAKKRAGDRKSWREQEGDLATLEVRAAPRLQQPPDRRDQGLHTIREGEIQQPPDGIRRQRDQRQPPQLPQQSSMLSARLQHGASSFAGVRRREPQWSAIVGAVALTRTAPDRTAPVPRRGSGRRS